MIFFSVLLILFLVFQGFILLEEETLIVFASFLWMDAAGNLFFKTIKTELESKEIKIEEEYLYFLNLKKETLKITLQVYKKRLQLTKITKLLCEYATLNSVYNSVVLYQEDKLLYKKKIIKKNVRFSGAAVLYNIFNKKLNVIFGIVDKNIIDLK